MKRLGVSALIAVSVLGLTVFLSACGGGGGGGGSSTPVDSAITSTTSGAKAAAAGTSAANTAASTSFQLSGIASEGSSAMPVPKLKVPFGTDMNAKMLNKLSTRLSPVLTKARSLKTTSQVSMIGYPVTFDCASSLTVSGGSTATLNSVTIDLNSTGNIATLTYNQCRSGDTLIDGTMTVQGTSNSATFTIGSSDAAPFSLTTYDPLTGTNVIELSTAYITMTGGTTGTAPNTTGTFAANGWFDDKDYTLDEHNKLVLNNFKVKDVMSATTIGTDAYDVNAFTINGSWTGTVYSGSTGTFATTVSAGDTVTFYNYGLLFKTPAIGSTATIDYVSLSGTFSVTTTPADKCIDGTYTFVTDTPIQADDTTGATSAGQVTINKNTVVVFNADGTKTITVDGVSTAAMTDTDLKGLCAL